MGGGGGVAIRIQAQLLVALPDKEAYPDSLNTLTKISTYQFKNE